MRPPKPHVAPTARARPTLARVVFDLDETLIHCFDATRPRPARGDVVALAAHERVVHIEDFSVAVRPCATYRR